MFVFQEIAFYKKESKETEQREKRGAMREKERREVGMKTLDCEELFKY